MNKSLILQYTLGVVFLSACRSSDDSSALESRVYALEEQIQTQQETIIAQQEQITALQEEVNSNTENLSTLVSEVEESILLTLQAQEEKMTEIEESLAEINIEDLATTSWVLNQEYASILDVSNLETFVAANAASISSNDLTISSVASLVNNQSAEILQNSVEIANHNSAITINTSNISNNTSAISSNQSSIATNSTDISLNTGLIDTNSVSIQDNASEISTNTDSIATNLAAIETNSDAIDTNTTSITTNASEITTNETAIDQNLTSISTNASSISTHETLLGDLDTAITDNLTSISLLEQQTGMIQSPAYWESVSTGQDGNIQQGNSGFLLLTSDGAFYMSLQQSTDAQSTARFYVTFYVNNPTTSDIQVDWLFCRSDVSGVVVDGTTVATPNDGDGTCKNDVSFTLTPGTHVIQIHDRDPNNVLEGFGVKNSWIAANGLEIDFDGLQAANDAGLTP